MVRDHEHDTDGIALDERVSSLLSAAAAPSEPGPLPGEGAALAAFRAARPQPRRSPHRSLLVAARSGVAAAAAGLLLTGGVAAATAGVLPGVAQDTVDGVLVDLGLTPRTHDASSTDDPTEDSSETAVPPVSSEPSDDTAVEDVEDVEDGDAAGAAGRSHRPEEAGAHGQEVSRTARATEATGADKGAEVSALASRGRSHAGQERPGAGHRGPLAGPGARGSRATPDTPRGPRRTLPAAPAARAGR